MPEIANVISSETIEVEWGNTIRDRTIQRYADNADRSAKHPEPAPGDLAYMANSGKIQVFHDGAWRNVGPAAGTILFNAAASAPAGTLLCQGQAVSRTTYADLFAAIGTTFGAGDGETTFNLPDLRQRFPLGVAASGTGNALGATGGAIDHTHTGPSHTHGAGSLGAASAGSHAHGVSGASGGATVGSDAPNSSTSGLMSRASVNDHTHSTGSAGSHAHSSAGNHAHIAGGEPTSAAGAHSHPSAGSHSHTVSGGSGGPNAKQHTHAAGSLTADSAGAHGHNVSGTTAAGGTGQTGSANPPFIALHAIIYY